MRPAAHRVGVVRLVAGGLAVTVLAALMGAGVELWRFGRTDTAAAARAEAEVRRAFADMTRLVREVAHAVASDPAVGASVSAESLEASRRLFDAVAVARQAAGGRAPLVAITIYDVNGTARAWAGRGSDLVNGEHRTPGGLFTRRSLFVTPSPLGLRLVYIEPLAPLAGTGTASAASAGAVAVEYVLSPAPAASTISSPAAYRMPTRVVPVALRPRFEGAGDRPGPDAFLLTDTDGAPLVEGSVALEALAAARAAWRRNVVAVCVALLGVTLLLVTGPLLDRRGRARRTRAEILLTAGTVAVILAGSIVLWRAYRIVGAPDWDRPLRLLICGGAAAAMAAAVVSAAVRLRLALRTNRRWPFEERALFVVAQLACGATLAALLVGFEWLLGRWIDPSDVDLRHFSLHPWSGPRLALLAGVLLAHAAALWAGTLGCVVAVARWRLARRLSGWHAAAFVLWIAPLAGTAVYAFVHEWRVPSGAALLGGAACAMAALLGPRLALWYRHATVVSRILALFMAFLLPALLVYPSVHFFVNQSTRELITTRYSTEAMNHLTRLLDSLRRALDEIDQQPQLAQLVEETSGAAGTPRTGSAFAVWNKTVLARARLTSAVELYDNTGRLVSRFALSFPEYTGTTQKPQSIAGCRWDVFAEAQPFGAEERRMLHAERAICKDGRVVGSVVVRVVFDYRTLPFISSQSPYFEILRSQGGAESLEGQPAGDVEVVVYGWGLRPIYTSGGTAWPLDEATFARIYASRTPFWTRLRRDDSWYEVYVSNDRAGIYAIGYQEPDVFEHLVRLAELTTLAGAAYALVLIGNAFFTRIARDQPRTGRALLREIRASFYRKLFLAFVLASIIPVLTLAFVIRAYFANLLFDGIAGEASRTASVAQRVIEESSALLRRGAEIVPLSDDVMVWISQVINQDVNIFDGPELMVTSERDLFESGLLPTRTPDDVYRAIALQRLPSYVSQDRIGTVPYMLAAAPVRTERGTSILTVPLALRQQEVEREIDELDRGVHLAALFFILLGAGIGLSMAERIADPVRRLTRATGRIARGDFDARIAVRSSDELRRLVDAFNGMAAELKAQRTQLERTHRIEAWAEMARQVAHEIKNPLTPIQLSAEHLRRVHLDRGEPMGPVLEGCVESILGQVRLLRQIAAEFSSFASSPTARPAAVDPVRLVHDVVEPYRAGLAGRVEIVTDVASPLPPVMVDRLLVSRALANIVENALHAMPGTGRLALAARADARGVTIAVSDTGVGMDAEALERVFEPYFSTKVTGTGLGLPIAKRNIELNGGSIDVASEKGRGTTVTVRLPLAEAAEPDAAGAGGRTPTR